MTDGHIHTFQYQGLVYRDTYHLPGSSARATEYADRYFCTVCLHVEEKNVRVVGSNFSPRVPGSVPA